MSAAGQRVVRQWISIEQGLIRLFGHRLIALLPNQVDRLLHLFEVQRAASTGRKMCLAAPT